MPPYCGQDSMNLGFVVSKGRLFRVKLGEETKRLALIQHQHELASRRERESVQHEFVRLHVRTPRCRLTSPISVLIVSSAWQPPPDAMPTFLTPEGGTISDLPSDSPYVTALLKRRSQQQRGCIPSSPDLLGAVGRRGRGGWTSKSRVVSILKEDQDESGESDSNSDVDGGTDSCGDEDSDGSERMQQRASAAGGDRTGSGHLPGIRSSGNDSRGCDETSPAASVHPPSDNDTMSRKEVMHRLETLLSPDYVRHKEPKEREESPPTRTGFSMSPSHDFHLKNDRPGDPRTPGRDFRCLLAMTHAAGTHIPQWRCPTCPRPSSWSTATRR